MHFYVDETGHTGPNLFDSTQPILSYGVLSSPDDLDTVAEPALAALRKKMGVVRLHAAELGSTAWITSSIRYWFCRKSTVSALISGRWSNAITPSFPSSIRCLTRG